MIAYYGGCWKSCYQTCPSVAPPCGLKEGPAPPPRPTSTSLTMEPTNVPPTSSNTMQTPPTTTSIMLMLMCTATQVQLVLCLYLFLSFRIIIAESSCHYYPSDVTNRKHANAFTSFLHNQHASSAWHLVSDVNALGNSVASGLLLGGGTFSF